MKLITKPSIKTELLPVTLIVLTGIISAYFYTHFPERVASHWNFAGQVDGYTTRLGGAIGMPIILVLMYLGLLFLPNLDPRSKRYTQFQDVYHIFKNLIVTIFFSIYILTGLFNLGYPVKINLMVPWIIGFMMIVMGNFMGKIKNNWFMGIKNPWTLSSENVWNKTHRLGGWLFVIWGITIIISPLLAPALGLSVLLGGAIAMVLGTTLYSYYLFKKEK